jgi:histidyl-tRNA synthetase
MPKITPRTFKGTRDLLPDDMRLRDRVTASMKYVFTRYGFAPLETPAVEFLDILSGKYGDEADKLLYPLAYKSGKELALRYDLTVPLARVIAMNPHLLKPFKRYQIQPVWRADNPQLKRGRYREFYQCDVDTVGSEELLADAEIISLMADVFDELNIGQFLIRINSRKILKGLITGFGFGEEAEKEVCKSVDKLDKEGIDSVEKELIQKGYNKECVKNIIFLMKKMENLKSGKAGLDIVRTSVPASDILEEGISEMSTLLSILNDMGMAGSKILFDFSLARGLDYYTGPIYEVILPERPEMGSVAGGGRYDDLVGLFLKESIPAVGTSFGLDRILAVLQDSPSGKVLGSDFDFLVCYFNEALRSDCLRLVRDIRSAGARAEMYFRPDKMKKQFGYADKKRIPYVAIYGEDEKKSGKITIKDMKTGEQTSVAGRLLEGEVKKRLQELS